MLLRTEVRSDLGIWPGLPNKRWVHVEYVDEGPTDLGTVGLAGGLEYYEPVSALLITALAQSIIAFSTNILWR